MPPGRPSPPCPLQGGGGGLPARPTAPPRAPCRGGSAAARSCRRPTAGGTGAQPAGRTAPRPGRQPLATRRRPGRSLALAGARDLPARPSRHGPGLSPGRRPGVGGAPRCARALRALRAPINALSSLHPPVPVCARAGALRPAPSGHAPRPPLPAARGGSGAERAPGGAWGELLGAGGDAAASGARGGPGLAGPGGGTEKSRRRGGGGRAAATPERAGGCGAAQREAEGGGGRELRRQQ